MVRLTRVSPLIAFAVLSVILAGCGGGTATVGPNGLSASSVRPLAMVSLPLTNALASAGDYRWGDIAGNVYSATYSGSFSYNSPTVRVSFDDTGNTTLSGTITATGLKPNFAYQMKLEGQPTVDAWANEQIGYLGRWWSPVSGNVTDAYYQAHKNTEAILGYLLFGFFITDQNGSATRTFRVDSSYHVLWNQAQNGAPLASAGPTQSWAPVWTAAAYDTGGSFISAKQTLFPEIQSGRPAPGQALLPTGNYRCAFVITEESFHNAYAGGGNWAAAMRNGSLTFAVTTPTAPSHDVAVTSIGLPSGKIRTNSNTPVNVTVANKGNVTEGPISVSLTDVTTKQPVGTLAVSSLAAGASTNVSFVWRPTKKGNHTLQAAVAPVSGETNLSNNTLTRAAQVN